MKHEAQTVTAVHPLTNTPAPQIEPGEPIIYQIRLKGQLGYQWAEWFEGMAITLADGGDTVLTGPIVDQATLHGLLKKVRDLGMPLLSVNRLNHLCTEVSDDK